MSVPSFGSHSMECWAVHDDCALRSAISYLSARVEHDRARLTLYRRALNDTRPKNFEDWETAVGLARGLMADNSKIDWKRADSA